MSKIETGRWSEQLRRMFGMAGISSVSADLSPEISPVVVLEEPTNDWLFLKSVRQVFVAQTVAAAIGFTSKFRIRNPVGSGVLAVMRTITMTSPTTTDLRVNINEQTVDFSVSEPTTVPDSRWNALGSAAPTSSLVASSANDQATPPAGDPLLEVLTLGNTPVVLAEAFPMLPGTTIDFGHPSVNISLRVWCSWIERTLPALER